MGQKCSRKEGHAENGIASGTRSSNKDDDVKRQVDNDVGDGRAIYELVNVKTGGGKLIELIKNRARKQSCSINYSSSTSSSSGITSGGQLNTKTIGSVDSNSEGKINKNLPIGMHQEDIDEHIRQLVEPLLYNKGQGKLMSMSQYWRARFGLGLIDETINNEQELTCRQKETQEESYRLVCWKLEERGFVGETGLHICFLLSTPSHMILAQKLLKLFPLLVNDIYCCDEYFGESCLHMAIVTENIIKVKWLLDGGAQVHERCLGNFFLPLDQKESRNLNERAKRILTGSKTDSTELNNFNWHSNEFGSTETNYDGYCYWGEYPLSFAASLGLSDCYRLLLAKGADPDRQDSNGNSTLHICVIANRIDMFDLCYSTGANLNLLNHQRLSPLTLAAKLERVEMLFHILTILRQINWIFCGVSFQQLPLHDLDTINTSDGSFNERSLLSIVVSGVSLFEGDNLWGRFSLLLRITSG